MASAAAAAKPAADCQPYGKSPCLLPFPNNLFTKRDRSTPTGLRVHLPAKAMPVNTKGQRISVAAVRPQRRLQPRQRGRRPRARARQRGGVQRAPARRRSRTWRRYAGKRQPIVIIDEQTGRRQLIWSELDANAPNRADTEPSDPPRQELHRGSHLRGRAARPAQGQRQADRARPPGLSGCATADRCRRAGAPSARATTRIFKALKRAKIGRSNLYEAWDFTVGLDQEPDLADAVDPQPARSLSSATPTSPTARSRAARRPTRSTSVSQLNPQIKTVKGSFQVPCYLTTCGADRDHRLSLLARASPTLCRRRSPATSRPRSSSASSRRRRARRRPARISLYGHGLLGSRDEVEAGNVQAMATEHNMVFCATDWWGLAEGDTPFDVTALQNLNHFPAVVDRLQQGVLNTLYLGRLMLNPQGFAANPAFRSAARLDTSHLYYDGNSQGGIMGGMTTAVAPDFRRAVLGVTGIDYGEHAGPAQHRLRAVRASSCSRLHRQVADPGDPRPDAAVVGSRRPGRLRAADDLATRCRTPRRTRC